ncbi:MAG: hypothetical protein IJ817_01820 [Clostridia bacterium]|nr:hypothetical protein [Clostridia bacterium]
MKANKSSILYVLQALKRGSSKERPISQITISKMLKLRGIECDRKTIGRDIDCLIDFGYKITKIKGGGCYLEGDYFAEKELDILVKSIQLLDLPSAANKHMQEKLMPLKKLNKIDV